MISSGDLCKDIITDESLEKYQPVRKNVLNALFINIYKVFNITSFSELSDQVVAKNIKTNIIAFEKEIGKLSIAITTDKKAIVSYTSKTFLSMYNGYYMKIIKLIIDKSNLSFNVCGVQTNAFIYIISLNTDINYNTILSNANHNVISNNFVDGVKKKIELRKDEKIDVKTTDTVQCKCGKSKVKYYTKQIKSSDEPETVFYECMECGRKWSSSN